MKLKSVLALSAAWCAAIAPLLAQASNWPERSIRVIVPFAAGGNTDGIARLTAERLTQSLGQSVVVENRPGANGSIAAQAVQRADPDGYTLLMAAMPIIAILPKVQKVPYDPVKDFVPISNIGSNPFALGIGKNVPATNLKEFVELVRKSPGRYNYASGGSGSVSHLSGALFLKRTGLEMMHVMYKGDAPAMAAVLGGEVSMYFGNLSAIAPQAKAGNVRMLAVSSSRPTPLFPDVPAIADTYPGFETLTWNGLMAPAGTPRAVVNRIADEVRRLGRDSAFVDRLAALGVDVVADGPDELAATVQSDIALWTDAVKAADLKE
ncbi:MAG: tripartite tricarboxylate transporter substrate binding protein [Pigmentiphaga sp.]|uniref:Bug family tripartite tricarboxylate transporter substrate binding protein n=1 Tax=Pigmentiphaga sp. TaxID=1977564 RepID=UPI0029B32AD8|nr:tripartite tricarboxylate transporter substrate binding protein [Pigmentiphaga sp.]MDX3905958.1 tripartite tricarboxylate transporter substrate binding protein [Pigmentiphaga sp.]